MPSLTNKTFLDDAGLQAIWGKITNKCATKEEFNKLKGCFYDSNYVYSTSKAYNNGDYAVYDGVLYICTDDVTAGTWAENSDSFSQITSLAVLQTLTAAFSLQAETVSGLVTNVGKIEDNISGSADEYSSSKAYSAGDMVMHDGTLYKCTDDVAAGPWSTNYDSFEDTTIVGELANAGGSSGPDPMVCNSGDEYDTTKAYAVGDRVTHEGVYYKCTTACSANTWAVNSTNFTADTLVSTANDLRSSFQDGCDTIAAALTAKGVAISSPSAPTSIANIITYQLSYCGNDTIDSGKVLKGYTFHYGRYNNSGVGIAAGLGKVYMAWITGNNSSVNIDYYYMDYINSGYRYWYNNCKIDTYTVTPTSYEGSVIASIALADENDSKTFITAEVVSKLSSNGTNKLIPIRFKMNTSNAIVMLTGVLSATNVVQPYMGKTVKNKYLYSTTAQSSAKEVITFNSSTNKQHLLFIIPFGGLWD